MGNAQSPNATQTIDSPIDTSGFFEEMSTVDPVVDSGPSILEGASDGEVDEGGLPPGEEGQQTETKVEGKEVAPKGAEGATGTNNTPAAPSTKVVTASKGESKFELPEDAVFSVKVDGKEVQVSTQDLIKNYQGKIPLDKHYAESKRKAAELERQEAELRGRETAMDTWKKEVLETFKKNPYQGFEKIVEEMGEDPAEYLPYFIAQSQKTVEQLKTLSEAELKALMIKKSNDFQAAKLKKEQAKLEEDKKATTQQREVEDSDRWFAQEAQTHQFTEVEVTRGAEMVQTLVKEGKLDLQTRPPKEVAALVRDYIINVERPFSMVETTLQSINPELLSNRQLVGEITKFVTPELTQADLKEIIELYLKDSTPTPEPKAPAQSVGSPSKGTQTPPTKRATAPKVAPKEETPAVRVNGTGDDVGPMSMDDIISGYGL